MFRLLLPVFFSQVVTSLNLRTGKTITICPIPQTFEIISRIGQGAHGTVFKVRDTTTNGSFAIKQIFHNHIEPHRIDTEVETMKIAAESSSVGHPNIVRLYCSEKRRKETFLLMEYCQGGDVDEYIERHGALPEDKVRRFLQDLTNGIEFLHANNIVHRDIKPLNMLLTSDGTLKMTDFGIATILQNSSTTMDSDAGAPTYMAPEILKGERYGAIVDLYAVGASLYQMFTNKLHFTDLAHEREYQLPKSTSPPMASFVEDLFNQNLSFDEFFTRARELKVAI